LLIPDHVRRVLATLRASLTNDMARQRLSRRATDTPPLRPVRSATAQSIQALWQRLKKDARASDKDEAIIADPHTVETAGRYSKNIENFIGTAKVPLGVIGPLRINGIHANGEFFVPLATSEAALVASYGRGADIITSAGGATAVMVSESVLRTPAFVFQDVLQAGLFIEWVVSNAEALRSVAEATTRHGKLVSIEPVIDNEIVFLLCRYTTGDASGQNMVTIATHALCLHIDANTPIKPRHWFLEANFSGDKKASFLGLLTGRGRKVTASVLIPDELVERKLHTSVERILEYGKVANLGALLSGQLGAQAHYANGLAALYIATGQDAACVAESATGYTRMDHRDGGIFLSVTLPNILVGSVGGGTSLPSQSAALNILGLKGRGNAVALAEVAAVLCLCGEISIIGAMAAGHFARAHHKLARER
jgi:hydroxymethylglutaryl-CoA reductase (NADPH)